MLITLTTPLAKLSITPEFRLADLGRAEEMMAQAIRLLESARQLVSHHGLTGTTEELEFAVDSLRESHGVVAGERNAAVHAVLHLADRRKAQERDEA